MRVLRAVLSVTAALVGLAVLVAGYMAVVILGPLLVAVALHVLEHH